MTTSDMAETREVGIIETERSLDVLLKSTTYQGMTDSEIARIIAYREEMARQEESTRQARAAVEAQTEAMREHWKKLADEAETAFNQAVFSTVKFQTVEGA